MMAVSVRGAAPWPWPWRCAAVRGRGMPVITAPSHLRPSPTPARHLRPSRLCSSSHFMGLIVGGKAPLPYRPYYYYYVYSRNSLPCKPEAGVVNQLLRLSKDSHITGLL